MKFLSVGYVLATLALFFYSYTQVDLNLTLSQIGVWQSIQKTFQHIGFYERSLSVGIFSAIIISLFALYLLTLKWVRQGLLNKKEIWMLVAIVTAALLFSYPAFSYDMYNYMFTAKTVLVYHKSPYNVIPLQFAAVDPYLSFMRWTHLPSAYTPLWILLTLPTYVLGFGLFLPVLWNIKILVSLWYLIAIWGIGEVLALSKEKQPQLGMAIFALNPLIIIESLVSAHNDIVMMALAMAAWALFLQRKTWRSWVVLSLSVALKLMTILLVPVFFFRWNRTLALLVMSIGLVAVVVTREVLPWYFVWILPFVAVMPTKRALTTLSIGISMGLLLRYAPYLYLGNWDPPAPAIKLWVTIIPIFISCIVILTQFISIKRRV